jgi:hypothetical protein
VFGPITSTGGGAGGAEGQSSNPGGSGGGGGVRAQMSRSIWNRKSRLCWR